MCVVPTSSAGHVAYRRLGFTVEDGGRHAIGTASSVVPLERGYLEIISIWDEEGARRSPRRRAIADYIEREAGGLIGFGLRTETIGEDVERLTDAGLAYGGPVGARRVTPNGTALSWQVLRPTPQPCPALMPILVTGDRAAAPFTGHPNTVTAVTAISVVSDDPDQLVGSYQVLLDAEPVAEDRPALGARASVFEADGLRVEVLTPSGPGVAERTLARQGPGPVQLELRADDLHALADPIGLDPSHGSLLIPPTLGCGVRMLVTAAE